MSLNVVRAGPFVRCSWMAASTMRCRVSSCRSARFLSSYFRVMEEIVAQTCLVNYSRSLTHGCATKRRRRGNENRPHRRRHLPHLDDDRDVRDHLQPVPDRRRAADARPHGRPLPVREHSGGDPGGARPGHAREPRAPALGGRRERRHGPVHGRGARRGARRLGALDPAERGELRSRHRARAQLHGRREARARPPHASVPGDAARPPLGLDDALRGVDGEPLPVRPIPAAGRPAAGHEREPFRRR